MRDAQQLTRHDKRHDKVSDSHRFYTFTIKYLQLYNIHSTFSCMDTEAMNSIRHKQGAQTYLRRQQSHLKDN